MATNTSDGLTWDQNNPVSADPRKDGAAEILGLRKGVKLRLDKEHDALGLYSSGDSSTGGGEHKRGSAKAFFQDDDPTERVDAQTTLLDSNDNGRLYVDTTGSAYVMKVFDDSASPKFQNTSGTSKITGNFEQAALVAGQITLAAGFIPDIVFMLLRTHPWMYLPTLISPYTIVMSTAQGNTKITFTLSGTDILLDLITADFGLPSNTAYWMALKY